MTARLVLEYDPDDAHERARIAAIVRDDGERLRDAMRTLSERLRRVACGTDHIAHLTSEGAEMVLALIEDEVDGLPLSLEE